MMLTTLFGGQWPTLKLIYSLVRTTIVYTGMIFVWVGLWDVLDLYCNGSELVSDVCYMMIGLTLLLITHAFFPQSGMKQIFYQTPQGQQPGLVAFILEYFVDYLHPQHMSWPIHAVHAVISLTASILFWLGTYNLFDLHLFIVDDEYSSLRHVLYMVAGLILLWASGTLTTETDVKPEILIGDDKPIGGAVGSSEALPSSPSVYAVVDGVQLRAEHRVLPVVLHYVRALISLYGSVIYWVGAYNMIDVEIWPSTRDRDIAYVVIAAALYVIQSCLSEFELYREEVRHKLNAPKQVRSALVNTMRKAAKTLWFTFRIVLGLVCSIMYWVGWWNVLTYYIVPLPIDDEDAEDDGAEIGPIEEPNPPFYALYTIYVIIGMIIIISTGTLLDNSGLLAPSSMVRRHFKRRQGRSHVAAFSARSSVSGDVMLSRDIDLDRMASVTPVDAWNDGHNAHSHRNVIQIP